REAADVALHEELALLALGRRGQRLDAERARAHPLGDRLDDAALAGGVASLEDQDDARAGGLRPFLQVAELDLQLLELRQVFLVLHPRPLAQAGLFLHGAPPHGFARSTGLRLGPAGVRNVPAAADRLVEADHGQQLVALGLRELILGRVQLLLGL